MKLRRYSLYSLLPVLLVPLLAGCPSQQSGSTPAGTGSVTAGKATEREKLTVGFLPATCDITCPVTDFSTRFGEDTRFKAQRFLSWPDVANAFKAGRLQATFMVAPLAMALREQGVPCHIVYLGHRDGSTIVVAKNNPAKDLKGLKGQTIAVPSKASTQNIVMLRLMEKAGMAPGDIKIKEVPPPQMSAALAAKSLDGYFVGEPFAAQSEMNGVGRLLYKSKDIWPEFICCVLVVSDELIQKRPELVKELVGKIAASGEWTETHRDDAAKVAAPYHLQDEKLLRYVLDDPERVRYRNLAPTDEEIKVLVDLAVKAGVIKKALPVSEYVDTQFLPKTIAPARIDMTDAGKPVVP